MRGLADLLFPERCLGCARPVKGAICTACFAAVPRIGPEVCSRCGRPGAGADVCPDCYGRELHFDWARQAAEFSPVVRRAVHQFKYSGATQFAVFLGALIVELAEALELESCTLTWIPASGARVRRTGVDHGRVLCELAASGLGARAVPLLARTRQTPPQTGMPPEERRANLLGAFAARLPSPEAVVSIDDVYTTGSTATEAARALKGSGARSVRVLCAARSFENL
jgi:predicted amidophosphoribosyltransferase